MYKYKNIIFALSLKIHYPQIIFKCYDWCGCVLVSKYLRSAPQDSTGFLFQGGNLEYYTTV